MRKFLYIVSFICLTAPIRAQYLGGGNDGFSSGNVCGTDLNGTSTALSISSISGPLNFCNNGSEEYNITILTGGATFYSWGLPPGASIFSRANSNNVKSLFGNTSGNITVEVSNGCGEVATNTISVSTVACSMFNGGNDDGYTSGYRCGTDLNGTATALSISSISGPLNFCNNNSEDYNINILTGGANFYSWGLPTGASILAKANSNNVKISFGNISGNITVEVSNGCGEVVTNTITVSNVPCSMFSGGRNDGFAVQPSCQITLNGGDAATLANFVTYSISCPGSGGSILTLTPNGGYSFDFLETNVAAFPYSGTYTNSAIQKNLANGRTYDIEIKNAAGCVDDIFGITTSATPTNIPLATITGSCTSPGANTWMYILDASGNAIMAVDDNSTDLGLLTATAYVDAVVGIYGGNAYLQRHFKITSSNPLGGGGANVRLYFTATELTSLTTTAAASPSSTDDVSGISSIGSTKYDGPTEDGIFDLSDATSLTFISQGSNGAEFGANYIEFNSPDFSELWPHASGNNAPLPIKLLYFIGVNRGNYNLLEWSTANEINNDYFTLERSINGVEFKEIATINGAGNSTSLNNYLFSDVDIYPDLFYYRLKQTDFSGQFEYSKIVSIDVNEEKITDIKVYPNPLSANDELNIYVKQSKTNHVSVQILDLLGRELISKSFTTDENNYNSDLKINMDNLAAGTYIVKVNYDNVIKRKKIIKN